MLIRIVKYALGVYYLVILSGCASILSVGDPNYSCDGQPGSPRCMSIEDAYEATNGEDYKEKAAIVSEEKRPKNKDAFSKDSKLSDPVSTSQRMASSAPSSVTAEPMVMRELPGYMTGTPEVRPVVKRRIWVAPWISASGQFYDQQLIYVKHSPGWMGQEQVSIEGGKGAVEQANVFKPLQVDRQKGNR